jgi:hypothetical protein
MITNEPMPIARPQQPYIELQSGMAIESVAQSEMQPNFLMQYDINRRGTSIDFPKMKKAQTDSAALPQHFMPGTDFQSLQKQNSLKPPR